MGVYETFSKRQKRLKQAGQVDVFQYDTLPEPFRIQVIYIWESALGSYERDPVAKENWQGINQLLSRERGVFTLGTPGALADTQCREFLLKADTSGALDIIELTFQVIDRKMWFSDYNRPYTSSVKQSPEEAIAELNHRFQEHGIGYQYLDGVLMRVDSQYLHAEAVNPALSLLQDQSFLGPEEEFLRAHEHYRKRNYKEAIAEALKSFESTMKAICDARTWPYDKNRATAKPLIDILLQQRLIPAYLQTHFTSLVTVMEAGLPTLRNKTSGHGQGPNPIIMPEYFAGYALHLAAANIVFLVEAHKAMK